MTTEVLAQALSAGVQATFGQGRVWYIKTASAALTIIAEKKGTGASIRKFINVGAGFKFTADDGDGWDYLRVTSAVGQNIEIVLSDDDVEVANAVSVTGSVSSIDLPSSALADTADTAQVAGSQTVIAANLSRRRITIGVLSTSLGNVRVAQTGGDTRGIEIQAGTFVEFRTTAALTVRCVTASPGTATWYAFEET